MKKFFASAAVICTIGLTTVTLNSCSSNGDEPVMPGKGEVKIDPNNFSVNLKAGETVTLDASKTYYMKGAVIVGEGATLTIPAGTKIICAGGTSTYLAVAQGGKIFSTGTASKPVVFTSETKKKADWGGIVLCGRAPINDAGSGGVSTSEVASLPYGGTVENDNSGVLTYTVIH